MLKMKQMNNGPILLLRNIFLVSIQAKLTQEKTNVCFMSGKHEHYTKRRDSGDKSLCDNKESKLEKKQGEKESEWKIPLQIQDIIMNKLKSIVQEETNEYWIKGEWVVFSSYNLKREILKSIGQTKILAG